MWRLFTLLISFLALSQALSGQNNVLLSNAAALEKSGIEKIIGLPDSLTLQRFPADPIHTPRELYSVQYQGYPIEGQQISVLWHPSKVLISTSLDTVLRFIPFSAPPAEKAQWVKQKDGCFHLLQFTDSAGFRKYTDPSYEIQLPIIDMHRYSGKDSSAKAWVFVPDPLSRNNQIYQGNYRDFNDSNTLELRNSQIELTLDCAFERDSFRLQNEWIRFAEVSAPKAPRAVSPDAFYYTRNDKRFEEVNAFYHLQELGKWWDSLGFGSYRDTVIVDVHGYNGADESGFDETVNPPTIEFGDGGVDDAEDADAIVHEYTHAAFHHVIPNAYLGTQRQAVEEGICDFMAVAYSLRYTKNQPAWVYNWDGHNEFWPGRTLDNQRFFPASLTNQTHVDGQLFGAALYDLAAQAGMDSVVKLVFHAMPLLTAGMSMPKAAETLLFADSVIFQSQMRWEIIKAFFPRGLLPLLGVHQTSRDNILVRNSEGFASGLSSLEFHYSGVSPLSLLDANCRAVFEFSRKPGGWYSINPADLKAGIYFIKTGSEILRIVKF